MQIDVKEQRFVDHLDPKAAGDLLVRLRKNIEVAAKQRPMGFNPRKVLIIGNEHHQKHDPVQGHVMYLRRGIRDLRQTSGWAP